MLFVRKNRINGRKRERGFTLLTTGMCMVGVIAVAGLAIDIGRMYVAKSESQIFTDSAALAATMELDGTSAGIARAQTRVGQNTNTWNFATSGYSNWVVSFASSKNGTYETNPTNPSGYRYARVTTSVPVPLFFMPYVTESKSNTAPLGLMLMGPTTANVKADSVGGQEPKTTFREGIFPFSPYAHNMTAPHFGLVPGQRYTLRWASNPKVNDNTCPGDNLQQMIDLNTAGGGSERGYIEENSASVIRAAIVDDYMSVTRGIGDTLDMTGGAKQTQRDAIRDRINQDSDDDANTYSQYAANNYGNGRRIVAVLINTGYPTYLVVQIGAFFLLDSEEYGNGGNTPFCAEYLGPWLQGGKHKGAADAGAYVARLVK